MSLCFMFLGLLEWPRWQKKAMAEGIAKVTGRVMAKAIAKAMVET